MQANSALTEAAIDTAINACFLAYCGKEPSAGITSIMIEFVVKNYYFLSVPEISAAFEFAAVSQSKEASLVLYGGEVTVQTLAAVLKAYADHRQPIVKAVLLEREKEQAAEAKARKMAFAKTSEYAEFRKKQAQARFLELKTKRAKLADIWFTDYVLFEQFLGLNFSVAQKNEFMERARFFATNSARAKVAAATGSERQLEASRLSEIMQGKYDLPFKEAQIDFAKKLAVLAFVNPKNRHKRCVVKLKIRKEMYKF